MKTLDSGLLVPDALVTIKGLVTVELFDENGHLKDGEAIPNLVTQVGDEYYSERAAGISSPPDQVTGMQLGTGTTAAAKTGAGAAMVTYITSSAVAIDGTYPQSNGTGMITWRTTYGAGVATNAAITEVSLINQSVATNSGAAAAATIARAVFSAKNKGALDTLVVTWTHTLLERDLMPKKNEQDGLIVEEVSGLTDDVQITMKGPDPDVWGDPEDRLAADIEAGKTDGINEAIEALIAAGDVPIVELEDGSVVKGPDPAVWGATSSGE